MTDQEILEKYKETIETGIPVTTIVEVTGLSKAIIGQIDQ